MEEGGRGHDIQSTVSYQHSLFFSFLFFDVDYYGSIMLAAMCCNIVTVARRGAALGYSCKTWHAEREWAGHRQWLGGSSRQIAVAWQAVGCRLQ